MEAYFDNSATTPVYPEVRDLVVKLMEQDYGNPSSLHQKGVDAARYVSDARDKIARLLKVQAKEIVFTSGGTESNNMALIGGALANRRAGNKIITTAVEHASVGSPLTFLEDMGFEIEASHHEVAPAQHEIDFKYDEAMVTADNIMTFKLAVKTIAKRHGLFASFMPKPKFGINGSGMHINMSLSKDGHNIFDDAQGELRLSKEAYYFIGGIMKHMKGVTAIMNPLVNSYKRLVPGYEAPCYIAWSATNRSPLIRIPASRGEGTRVELRSPDPAANPYLALAVCLAAGLDGIENKIEPPAEVPENVYELSEEEKESRGIESIPADLHAALKELKKDTFVQEVLGKHITGKYLEAKEEEWMQYRTQVTAWEIEEYLYKI